MKIEMYTKERMELEEFADKHGLVMEIHERTPSDMGQRWTENDRYYAHFKDCEIKDGPMLRGEFGDGSTPQVAMNNYARSISNKLLVIDACKNSRREIWAPLLTYGPSVTVRK